LDWKNTLYFGNNLEALRANVPEHSVDLIYLDPPFNSNANYDVLFNEKTSEQSADRGESAYSHSTGKLCG